MMSFTDIKSVSRLKLSHENLPITQHIVVVFDGFSDVPEVGMLEQDTIGYMEPIDDISKIDNIRSFINKMERKAKKIERKILEDKLKQKYSFNDHGNFVKFIQRVIKNQEVFERNLTIRDGQYKEFFIQELEICLQEMSLMQNILEEKGKLTNEWFFENQFTATGSQNYFDFFNRKKIEKCFYIKRETVTQRRIFETRIMWKHIPLQLMYGLENKWDKIPLTRYYIKTSEAKESELLLLAQGRPSYKYSPKLLHRIMEIDPKKYTQEELARKGKKLMNLDVSLSLLSDLIFIPLERLKRFKVINTLIKELLPPTLLDPVFNQYGQELQKTVEIPGKEIKEISTEEILSVWPISCKRDLADVGKYIRKENLFSDLHPKLLVEVQKWLSTFQAEGTMELASKLLQEVDFITRNRKVSSRKRKKKKRK